MHIKALVTEVTRLWLQRGTATLPPTARRRQEMTNVLMSLIAVFCIPYVIAFAIFDFQGLIVPILVTVFMAVAMQFSSALNRVHEYLGGVLNLTLWLIFAASMCYMFSRQSGLQFFFIAGSTSAIAIFGVRQNVLSPVSIAMGVCGFFAVDLYFTEPALSADISPILLQLMYAWSVLFSVGVIFCMVYYPFGLLRQAESRLQEELDYSERLLGEMMPAEIAAELKRHPGRVIAQRHDLVTILFADIVGFTPRASRQDPGTLVRFLNDLFTRFDQLADAHKVEKIKTIGDAFMAAGGLPRAQFDHASRIADLALDMMAAVNCYSEQNAEDITLRIGIHSGPAVAGVIGTHKPLYDVWGDTVNTAARLETYGQSGRIQVTHATKILLEDVFDFSHRGEIVLKGKGTVDVWYLDGRKSDLRSTKEAAE